MSSERAVDEDEKKSSKPSSIDTSEPEPREAADDANEAKLKTETNSQEEESKSTTDEAVETTQNEELEELFADRYTEQNSSYVEICKGFPPVIVIHPWASRTKRVFDYARGRGDHRGSWRGGRENNWRGRGGGRGQWRGGGGDRGNWRGGDGGNNRGKRSWDYNGDRSRNDQGGDQRVHYPGRN